MGLPNRARSGWEIATAIQTAITSRWAATVSELEALWAVSELQTTISSTDVAIGAWGEYSGGVSIAIVGTGDPYDWRALSSGGYRRWTYEIVVIAPSHDGTSAQAVRMIEHYLQVVWVCIWDYFHAASPLVEACVRDLRRLIEIRTPEVDPGVLGGTLEVELEVLHSV